jgi:hypothetical protein
VKCPCPASFQTLRYPCIYVGQWMPSTECAQASSCLAKVSRPQNTAPTLTPIRTLTTVADGISCLKHVCSASDCAEGKYKHKLRNAIHFPTRPQQTMTMTTSLPSPDLSLSDTASQPDEQQIATVPKTSAASQQSNEMKSGLLDDSDGSQMGTPDSGEYDKIGKTTIDPRAKISSLLKDKEKEWTAVVEKRKGPLRLLDLPMDVLKEIVKEVRGPTVMLQACANHPNLSGYTYQRLDSFSSNSFRPP